MRRSRTDSPWVVLGITSVICVIAGGGAFSALLWWNHEPVLPSLYQCVLKSDEEGVKRLLGAGADPNEVVKDALNYPDGGEAISEYVLGGSTPLHAAVRLSNKAITEVLLKAGARWDMFDAQGHAPIHLASENESTQIAGILLEDGCPVDLGSKINRQALQEGPPPEPSGLPEYDFRKSSVSQTALQLAAAKGNVVMVEYLISKGADVHARTGVGMTALHAAAASRQPRTAALLIRHGADVNAASFSGLTPLHLASSFMVDGWEQAEMEILDLLLENGAKIGAKDVNGDTPFYYATREQNQIAIRKLTKAAAAVL